MQSKHKQNVNIADETLTDYSFLSRYHYTKSKNYIKDDIEFVTEFPLGHLVSCIKARNNPYTLNKYLNCYL